MSRFLKNVISIILIVLIIGSMYLTFNAIGKNININDNNQTMEMREPPMGDMSNMTMGEPPEKPSGEMPSGQPPEKPGGENFQNQNTTTTEIDTIYYLLFALESAVLGLIIMYLIVSKFNKLTFKETFKKTDKSIICMLGTVVLCVLFTFINTTIAEKQYLSNNININSNNNTPSNQNNSSITYSSQKEITSEENITSGEYKSETADENVISVSKTEASLDNITVNKTGDSSGGDNTSFYGTNSAIIAKDGATLDITNSTIETNANGANGVFSYGGSATTQNAKGDGTTINISDSIIKTKKDNSGGIMTTGGGVMNATNLTITTDGTSSAAIRSDRGGGTVVVDAGTYTTNGKGSPAIYSTADITVKNAKLISNASEGIVIEGKNSVTLQNVTLIDTNNELNGQSTTYKNIFLYQSMSGDADTGTSVFTSKNSTITTNNGDTFYVTNTTATINLENNKIVNNDKNGNFLRIQKDSWGKEGSNGGNVVLNLTNQEIKGNVVVDSISTLEINLKNKSTFKGNINKDNTAKKITLSLDKSSKLTLTSDIYVTEFSNEDIKNSNINFNGYKLYVDGNAIN